jgi:hypothetical protein
MIHPIVYHIVIIAFIICLFLWARFYFVPKRVEPGTVTPVTKEVVMGEYYWLLDRISEVKSKSELTWIETQAMEFYETHKTHFDVYK